MWNRDCHRSITTSQERPNPPEEDGTRVTRKAGSIVINRLRDRIQLGRYFGRWSAGDRLPSVRDVAALEDVDRKTAAAAYRRLELEGLVRVEPRSGVYLTSEARSDGRDPMRRLHAQWLESTLASGAELGLDAETATRMLQSAATVEKRRVPVVDPDPAQAELLARELSSRTGLECVATRPGQLPAQVGPLRDPPFIVATPEGAEALRALDGRVPIVRMTLAPELFDEVCRAAEDGPVTVVVATVAFRRELRQALERGLVRKRDRVRIEVGAPGDPGGNGKGRVLVWPGVSDRARDSDSNGGGPHRLIADSTLAEIRSLVARTALHQFSTSSVGARRG